MLGVTRNGGEQNAADKAAKMRFPCQHARKQQP